MSPEQHIANLSALVGDESVEFITHHFMQIAPEVTDDESHTWVLAVDSVILALTLVGSFFILFRLSWNEVKGRATTTRMRFVESLIFTDVLMGIVGLIGCGLQLDGKPLVMDSTTCDGLGVTMVAIIFSQHLWTLALAVSTFMILVHPLHSATSWIEKYWYWAWPVIWAISFAVSVIGYVLYGYGPAGGICYYQNNSGLFAELIQFLPRAIVFLCIALLYGKLYVFLRRPDKIRTGLSDTPGSSHPGSWFASRRLRRSGGGSSAGFFHRRNHTVILDANGHRVGHESANHQSALSIKSHTSEHADLPAAPPPVELPPPPPTKLEPRSEHRLTYPRSHRHPKRPAVAADAPPWEHVELPAFQVDGERFGGTEYPSHDHRLWRDWHGFGGRKRMSHHSFHSSTPPLTSPTKGVYEPSFPCTVYEEKVSPTTSYFPLPPTSPTSPTTPASPNSPASPNAPVDPISPPPALSIGVERKSFARSSGSGSDGTAASLSTTAVDSSAPVTPRTPKDLSKELNSPPRRGSVAASISAGSENDRLMSPPQSANTMLMYEGFDPNRRGSIPDGTIPFRRASGLALPPLSVPPMSRLGTPRLSIPGTPELVATITPATPLSSTGFGKDSEKGFSDTDADDGDDGDDDWDLFRMLKEEPPDADNDPFAVQTQRSENVEYVQESLASYLNRKTALLMLWFPLGYVALFSVSTIRLIYDFVGNPPIELRALSRWMMFGQGLLDGIIYGIVEWQTKRVVRKRVRKGTFSPHHSRNSGHHSGGLGSAVRNFSARHNWHRPHESVPKEKEEKRDNMSPTVSFVDPESSILQRLETPRKHSESSASGECTQ